MANGKNEVRRPTDRTRALAPEKVRDLVNATAFAEWIGRPLNAALTIVWKHTPLYERTEESWADLQTRLLTFIREWLAARDVPIPDAFVWTRERAKHYGAHTHLLIHLGGRPRAVVDELIAAINVKFSFNELGVWYRMGRDGINNKYMRTGKLKYMMKGFDFDAFCYPGFERENCAEILGIEKRKPGSQGIIGKKRCGWSQSIGIAARDADRFVARAKAGSRQPVEYKELRELLHVANWLNPQKKPKTARRRQLRP